LTEQVPGASDMSPAWSPDGRRIAFARFLSSAVGDVYTIPAAGGASTRVTNDSHNIRGIAWTRDSRSMVISSNRGGVYGLWKVSADDHAMRPLNAPGETAIQPVLSSDNRLLIYADATTTTNIWRFDRETQTSERFIASTRHSNSASWSPDGRRIAFASDRSGSRELWIANADGSQARQLTKFGRGDFGRISWSPDSAQIVFEARPDGHAKAFVIRLDGGAMRPLHDEPFEQRYAAWSHDGHWIYLVSTQGGKEQVWRVHEAGDAREMLCDCAPGDIFEAPDGHSLFLGPMPGIWELPLPAGKPHAIPGLENINPHRWWTVGSDGIWFYDETREPPGLSLYSFASRKVTHIVTLDRAVPVSTPSLSLSPNGRYLLFSRFETAHSKLMTIRGLDLDR
jgi:Tol biopolymer transport system component